MPERKFPFPTADHSAQSAAQGGGRIKGCSHGANLAAAGQIHCAGKRRKQDKEEIFRVKKKEIL